MVMNTGSSDVNTNVKCATESQTAAAALQGMPSCCAGLHSCVSSRDTCTRTSHTLRPRLTRREQHTPDPCASTSTSDPYPSTPNTETDAWFADRNSGAVFSGLHGASGERITPHEFRKASGLAPTLHLIIPSSHPPSHSPAEEEEAADAAAAASPLPTFSLTVPTPTTPRSPIYLPSPTTKTSTSSSPFTRTSYYALAARSPPSARVPYLPTHCPHTLRPFVPLRSSGCRLCALQLLACETWWRSAGAGAEAEEEATPALRAPRVLPAACDETTRSVFYALGIPLGALDRACVDLDVVEAIVFIPRAAAAPRRGKTKKKKNSVGRASSRIRMLFRRARHFLSAPARVPMVPTHMLPRRRVIARP